MMDSSNSGSKEELTQPSKHPDLPTGEPIDKSEEKELLGSKLKSKGYGGATRQREMRILSLEEIYIMIGMDKFHKL